MKFGRKLKFGDLAGFSKIGGARLFLIGLPVLCCSNEAAAQIYSLSPPVFEVVDENNVSLMSGKIQISPLLVQIGPLSFVANNTTGIGLNSLYDANYGQVYNCLIPANYGGTAGLVGQCTAATAHPTVQAVLGKERTTFSYINGQYVPEQTTGETYVDHGNGFCTWTRKDGRQVKYYARYPNGSPLCLSSDVYQIVYPDGRTIDYHHYGQATSATRPILALTSNDGFMLKYNYTGTPAIGAQASVVGINRAFQACDPAALSCTLNGSWPTGTISYQNALSGSQVYKVTLVDQTQKKHVYGLDIERRVLNYQPPGAQVPVITYSLCTPGVFNPANNTTPLTNCFGETVWNHLWNVPAQSAFFDQVNIANNNGQIWSYSPALTPTGGYPPYMKWSRVASSPFGTNKSAWGSSTPDDYRVGATAEVWNGMTKETFYFATGLNNPLVKHSKSSGHYFTYQYDGRNNVTAIEEYAAGATTPSYVRTASYPSSCANLKTCNQPDYIVDANGHRTDLTYDPAHGGVLTETGPAVNGVRPQKRFTYAQRYAWYLNGAGVMTRETRPIWVRTAESYCRTSAASGAGCAAANDEVVTSYEFGPDSGPNNLIVRGTAVTADGQTLRTCYGHDRNGNTIWERAPRAGLTSCPDY